MTTQPLAHDEVVPVLDFGSQTAQLIARRVRELGVFALLVKPDITAAEMRAMHPSGVILSGGPASVYESDAPSIDPEILTMETPTLGVCYGMQVACRSLGCHIDPVDQREFGRAKLEILDASDLFDAIPQRTTVWMSHGDQIAGLDKDFDTLASTPTCLHAAVRHKQLPFFGVQFHPEVTHTPHGGNLLQNFLFSVCKCKGDWRMVDFVEVERQRIRKRVADDHVICGLSGGVDSSVCAALLASAIGAKLTCVFVDNGLLRKNERELVERTFRDHFDIDLRVVDASEQFLKDLAGVTDPQEKRKRIGARFINVFKNAAADLRGARYLAQGTLYPDVIESGQGYAGASANIKLHHNVGGLPEDLGFELIEPLRDLFKDEVRQMGEVLGLPAQIVWRHPFPGPGLAVRIVGEVTPERLSILRECDAIFLEEIVAAKLYRQLGQVFAVLLPVQSVGVMGDGRTYACTIALRAVETEDFMTADWARLPYEALATISSRIVNEVAGVNRVVYDITSKPPATIEWE